MVLLSRTQTISILLSCSPLYNNSNTSFDEFNYERLLPGEWLLVVIIILLTGKKLFNIVLNNTGGMLQCKMGNPPCGLRIHQWNRANREYLAWARQWEISFLGFVCSRRGAPRPSWGAPERPGSSGRRPGPSSPSPWTSGPTCTAFRSDRIFPGRTRCRAAPCLERGGHTRGEWRAFKEMTFRI